MCKCINFFFLMSHKILSYTEKQERLTFNLNYIVVKGVNKIIGFVEVYVRDTSVAPSFSKRFKRSLGPDLG